MFSSDLVTILGLFLAPFRDKIAATSDQMRVFALKCVCGQCSAPDPAEGAHSAPPDLLAGFKGPISKGKGRGGEMEEGRLVFYTFIRHWAFTV